METKGDVRDEYRVVIIGGGASGVLTAIHLLQLGCKRVKVILIEPRAELGAGVPYSTKFNSHLLNVPAAGMSAFENDRQHFLRWLSNNAPQLYTPASFVPRKFYGDYLRASLLEICRQGPKAICEHYRAAATGLAIEDSCVRVLLDNNQRVIADCAVIATGHQQPSNPITEGGDVQVVSGWSAAAYNDIDPSSSILLVGAGLTAVDAVLALHERGHTGTIHAVSRHGKWPLEYGETVEFSDAGTTTVSMPIGEHTTVLALMKKIRALATDAQEAGRSWYATVDGLRPQIQSIWKKLPIVERRRFLRHVRPFWEIHRHRMPRQVATQLAAIRSRGQLTLYSGRIVEAAPTAAGIRVGIKLRGREEKLRLQVSRVINCSGAECDPGKFSDSLMRSLLADGLAQVDPLRLGLKTDHRGALISTEGAASAMLFTLGPLMRGMLWESTSVPEIRVQASMLAGTLLALFHIGHEQRHQHIIMR